MPSAPATAARRSAGGSRARHRLLLVYAHPDDESISNGVTMAHYAAQGVHVALVTATLGEEGEILLPEVAHLAAGQDDALGPYRRTELDAAVRELGITEHSYLGGPGRWRDSGMMGAPTNDDPRCFWQADVDEAAAELVRVVRELQPQVLVTYDEIGGYGHPDHIQVHRVSMRAADLAADPAFRPDLGAPWEVAKIYWTLIPRSAVQAGIDALRAAGEGVSFFGAERAEDLPFAAPDELVTTRLDADDQVGRKMAAMAAHATQITLDGPFFALSNNLGQKVWSTEFYRLVRGQLGPRDEAGYETDLFAGIE
jgi:N-acetyl-1-D-myo-inositol-2-amino-2-deoxy-alpha-D-glucopyranoside deacetylase